MNDNYELFHFGVKGMKWGVRKKSDRVSTKELRSKAVKSTVKAYNKDLVGNRFSDGKTKIKTRPEVLAKDVAKTAVVNAGLKFAEGALAERGSYGLSAVTHLANLGLTVVNAAGGVMNQVLYRETLKRSQREE